MARLFNFLRLLKFIWDHSMELLTVLNRMQANLFPVVAGNLRTVARGLEGAGGLVADVEKAVGDTLDDAAQKIDLVKVPKLELQTAGFYDKLVESLRAMHIPILVEPDQQTRDLINQVRVLEVNALASQASPFGQFSDILDTQGTAIKQDANRTRTQWQQAAEGLRLLADVFDPPH